MKVYNLIFVSLLMLLAGFAYAQKHLSPNYVVTTMADTILFDKLTWNKGITDRHTTYDFTLKDGKKMRFLAPDIFRIKETRKGKTRMYEMVPFYNERRQYSYYRKMVVVTQGLLSLYYDDLVGDWTPYVRGNGLDFDRYIERLNGFKKLKKLMDQCPEFKTEYNTRKKKRFRNLHEMVRFYNLKCDNQMK